MPPKLFRVVWPDRAVSFVTLSIDPRGYAVVKLTGTAERLSNLLDYRNVETAEQELHYLARKAGARITTDEERTGGQI